MPEQPYHYQGGLLGPGYPPHSGEARGPTQCLTFLGITLDTQCMEARLLSDKLSHIRYQLSS